jgi:hypothetical protein
LYILSQFSRFLATAAIKNIEAMKSVLYCGI